MSPIDNGKMSAFDLANRQLTLDRMVKHLRKLRWIGRAQEADRIVQILAGKMQTILETRTLQTALPGDRVVVSSPSARSPAIGMAINSLSRPI
jgi:hypothetical protein